MIRVVGFEIIAFQIWKFGSLDEVDPHGDKGNGDEDKKNVAELVLACPILVGSSTKLSSLVSEMLMVLVDIFDVKGVIAHWIITK